MAGCTAIGGICDNAKISEVKIVPPELIGCNSETGRPEYIYVDRCAEYVKNELNIKTINKEMYYYENGVYKKDAEDIIRTYLTNMFFNEYNSLGDCIANKTTQNEIIYKLQTLTRINLEDFDKNIYVINMANGLYNWYTGEFMVHTPDYLSIIQIPVNYEPSATCPNIDKMLEIAAEKEDITKLYEFVAYLLYRGYPIQKLLILFGPPNTGKSVFLDMLVKFIGEVNKSSVSLQDISKDRTALVDFYGKLANLCGELSKEVIYTDAVKKLTSNTDTIRARDVYKSRIEYINFAKLVFVTNILPPVGEDIKGFAKRVEIAIFDHVYTKEEYDKEFLDSLTSPKELSGLFNKAVKLLPDLIKRNAFTNQLTTEKATKLYSERSTPEENFLDKFVSENPEKYVGKKELHEFYVKYCDTLKISPRTINRFGAYIKENINWISKEDMKAVKKVVGVAIAIWPNTFFDQTAFNRWLDNKD